MLKNKIKDISVFAIFGIMLIVGTFLDFKISDKIYSQNNWLNIFIELIAKMPIYAIGIFACANMFFLALKKENRYLRILFSFIYIAGAIVCGALMLEDVISVFIDSKIKYIISAVVGIAFFIALVVGLKNKEEFAKENKKEFIVILFSIATIVVLTFLIKSIMDRSRFADIILQEGSFTKWFKKGVGGDSMPSGHVASFVALFSCIPLYNKLKKNTLKPWIEYLILMILAIIVALSRISNGSHFMSDVAVAGIMAFVVSKAYTWIFLGFEENKLEITKGSFVDIL